MKNEFGSRMQRIFAFMMLPILGYAYNLSAADDELDLLGSLVGLSLMFAVGLYAVGRLHRLAAVLCPAPAGDLQLLLSRLSAFLGEFGYHALDTVAAGRWGFEAPVGLKGLLKRNYLRKVWVESDGPSLFRVTASAATIREIRKHFPEAVAVPYTGPQPWVARGKGFLVPCAIASVLSIMFYLIISLISPAGIKDAIRVRKAAMEAARLQVTLPASSAHFIDEPSSTATQRGAVGPLPEERDTSEGGRDIRIPLELSSDEAAQGGRKLIMVPGRAGKLAVMVPRGIKDGWRLRVRGAGNPGIHGGSSGD